MEDIKRVPRRAHSTELRSQVLFECAQPGASVAAVAMAHGLNANLVRKWQKAGAAARTQSAAFTRNIGEFVALTLAQHSTPLSLGIPDESVIVAIVSKLRFSLCASGAARRGSLPRSLSSTERVRR